MRESKKGVLVLGLTVAALCAPVNSSFAQGHTRMSGPPQPPKTTTTPTGTWLPKSIAYIKASNTRKDNQFGSAIALSADGNTLAVSAPEEDSAAKGVNGVSKDRAEFPARCMSILETTRAGSSRPTLRPRTRRKALGGERRWQPIGSRLFRRS